MDERLMVRSSPRTSRGSYWLRREAKLSARAGTHACVRAGLVLMQATAAALIWNWLAGGMGLPKIDPWLAVLIGCLAGLVQGAFSPRYFSWSESMGVLARTGLMVGIGFVASKQLSGDGRLHGLLEKLLGMG